MKSKLISIFFILLAFTLIGCDPTDNNTDTSVDIITSDITLAPAYLNLENDPLVRIIDSSRTPDEIFDEVWNLVSEVKNG